MKANAGMAIYTIGHSNHEWSKFVGLLKLHEITLLIDVRSKPVSRFPHFTRDNLMKGVRAAGIDYRFGGNVLGGLTPVAIDAPLFVAKMDAALSFMEQGYRVVLMCSEGKPSECHRAGKLTAWIHRYRKHVDTQHILTSGNLADAREYEPKVLPKVMWKDFKTDLSGQLLLDLQ